SDIKTRLRSLETREDTGWVPLSLGAGVLGLSGSLTPSARRQDGVIRLKGVVLNSTGATINPGVSWATVPAPMSPTVVNGVTLPAIIAPGFVGTPIFVSIANTGALSMGGAIANTNAVCLDGLSYTLR